MSGLEIIGFFCFHLTAIVFLVGPFIAVRNFQVMRQVVYLFGTLFLLFGFFTWFFLRPWDLDNTTSDIWNAIPFAMGVLYLLIARLTPFAPKSSKRHRNKDIVENTFPNREPDQFVSRRCPACNKIVNTQDRNDIGHAVQCPACGQFVVMDVI